ncbi:hypothetical protein DDD_0442 [Nonlabens dokdonensis DSW-6]|uniref:Uncharacterized protein n=2 Tax=Nonlabens dokdonensis TaxID=328515 RepID=L7W625_NONDD|nr:hypothetical protein DDD_0442 [Nonlabens dokdonensis DSW-6]
MYRVYDVENLTNIVSTTPDLQQAAKSVLAFSKARSFLLSNYGKCL